MTIENCWYKDTCSNNCSPTCIRFVIMKSLCEKSNIPQAQWKAFPLVADRCDKESFLDLQEAASNIDLIVADGYEANIIICSNGCGNGKTTWAIKLMLNYFHKIWHKAAFERKGLFVNVTSYLIQNKDSINNPSKEFAKTQEDMMTVPFLILDDIGSSTLTKYEQELLYKVVDSRFNSNLFTLFTSNCVEENLQRNLGERLYSRVWTNSIIIQLFGKDKRGQGV